MIGIMIQGIEDDMKLINSRSRELQLKNILPIIKRYSNDFYFDLYYKGSYVGTFELQELESLEYTWLTDYVDSIEMNDDEYSMSKDRPTIDIYLV